MKPITMIIEINIASLTLWQAIKIRIAGKEIKEKIISEIKEKFNRDNDNIKLSLSPGTIYTLGKQESERLRM